MEEVCLDERSWACEGSTQMLQVGVGMAHPVELVKELTVAFEFFDLDGDGKLSVKEMATVVRSLSGEEVAEEDVEKLVGGVDADGDGCLDLGEFIDLNTRSFTGTGVVEADQLPGSVDALVVAFNKFDADGDGFISAQELHRVLVAFGDEKFSLEECRGMISSVDENGDQLMSFQEFRALMMDDHSVREIGTASVKLAP